MKIITKSVRLVPFPNPYVSDGLIAMWDGVWNAGWGIHDGASAIWRDLVGNADFTLTPNGSWGQNCLACNGLSATSDGISLDLGYTIECVAEAYSEFSYRTIFNLDKINMRKSFVLYRECHITGSGSYMGFPKTDPGLHLWSASINPPLAPSVDFDQMFNNYHLDGLPTNSVGTGNWGGQWNPGDHSDYASIGAFNFNGSVTWPYRGRIFCIRAYSRTLTSAEIAANYTADKARFCLLS